MVRAKRAYFGGYLTKKGENLATHEDIDKLVDQVRAVTQTTKEIETKISDQVWDRQKRWELKREVIFEATRALAGIEDALVNLHSLTQVEKKENDITWVKARLDKISKWTKAYSIFEEANLLVMAVCSREAGQAFLNYGGFMVGIALPIANDNDSEIYNKKRDEHNKKHLELQNVIRKELGIDPALAKAAKDGTPTVCSVREQAGRWATRPNVNSCDFFHAVSFHSEAFRAMSGDSFRVTLNRSSSR